MRFKIKLPHKLLMVLTFITFSSFSQGSFDLLDVFELKWVSDPQISPDGKQVVYTRNFNDLERGQAFSNLWVINYDGSNDHPITFGNNRDITPSWSPDSKSIVYKSDKEGAGQLYILSVETGKEMKLIDSAMGVSNPVWSPDGRMICFTGFVESKVEGLSSILAKPDYADWGSPPRYVDDFTYRADGTGYSKKGYTHLFTISVDGTKLYQLTHGEFNDGSDFSWSPDGMAIIFSANRNENRDFDPLNSEIYEVTVEGGITKALTSSFGPAKKPRASTDGKFIAYIGYDDNYRSYQVKKLHLIDRNSSLARNTIVDIDRDIENIEWSSDGSGLFFQYDDHGNTRIAFTDLKGKISNLASNVGGQTLDRPYSDGTFSVSQSGRFAFTLAEGDHPADLAVGMVGDVAVRRLTSLNRQLFSKKKIGKIEETWFTSKVDNRLIQGWVIYPFDFDSTKRYPLVLEIHGGPFENYGARFSAELQLLANKGYIVLYVNPRGSSSYGEEFGNLIHQKYPGPDSDDLISCVDEMVTKSFVDERNLFITGGSGGGILTSWIISHDQRFRAAVISKPIINWYSWMLSTDRTYIYKYWFPGAPWDFLDTYMKRSPISLVKNVRTPTLLITGEADFRTPISETEQYYTALKLNGVETAMLRIPGASHDIAKRPSDQVNKVAYMLYWFEKYRLE